MKVLIEAGRVKQIVDGVFFPEPHPPGLLIVDAPSNVQPGWGYSAGLFKMPSSAGVVDGPHTNHTNAQLAKQRLLLSDRVVVRFYELGTPVSNTWKNYRTTLRQIIMLENDQASPQIPLPARPALPAGMIEPGL